MDSFFSQAKTDDKPHPEKKNHHPKPSNSELMSSAQFMAEAAKSSLGQNSDKVDKGKVAGAAADLLDAAAHYGKLEDKSFGKYIDKAEDYLHQYHSSHSTTTTTTAHSGGHSSTTTTTTDTTEHSTTNTGGDGHSGGGYGDYLKMAEGFLKKH